MSKVEFYIGTSGYSYQHWKKDVFYPSGLKENQMLEFYTRYFNTVELNVTFYRIPSPGVFKSWYRRTPDDFKFVVKGTRIITHLKKLIDYENILKNFIALTGNLKGKLALILWQFPPGFKYQREKLVDFLKKLNQIKFKDHLYVFEFRHSSWFNSETYRLFEKYQTCLCIADSPNWPQEEVITSDYLYLRFHGGRELYGSEYSKQELENWARKVKKWIKDYKLKEVFAYFNNDAYGFAVKNALYFKNLLIE